MQSVSRLHRIAREAALQSSQPQSNGGQCLTGFVMQISRDALALGLLGCDNASEQFGAQQLPLLGFLESLSLQFGDLVFRLHLEGAQEADDVDRSHTGEAGAQELNGKAE